MTNVEFTNEAIEEVLMAMRQRGKELFSIEDQIRHNEFALTNAILDLSSLHDKPGNLDEDYTIAEIEKLNTRIKVLAEAHTYLTQFEQFTVKSEE